MYLQNETKAADHRLHLQLKRTAKMAKTTDIRKTRGWFVHSQPNGKDPKDKNGDCVVRAICHATNRTWLEVFDDLFQVARKLQMMPNERKCFAEYLKGIGFKRVWLKPEKGQKRMTVGEFCGIFNKGVYLVDIAHHLTTVKNGKIYDTWNCGNKAVCAYWEKI